MSTLWVREEDNKCVCGYIRNRININHNNIIVPTMVMTLCAIFLQTIDFWIYDSDYKHRITLSGDRTQFKTNKLLPYLRGSIHIFGRNIIDLNNKSIKTYSWSLKVIELSFLGFFQLGLKQLNGSNYYCITQEGYHYTNNVYHISKYFKPRSTTERKYKINDLIRIKICIDHAQNSFHINFYKNEAQLLKYGSKFIYHQNNKNNKYRLFCDVVINDASLKIMKYEYS